MKSNLPSTPSRTRTGSTNRSPACGIGLPKSKVRGSKGFTFGPVTTCRTRSIRRGRLRRHRRRRDPYADKLDDVWLVQQPLFESTYEFEP